jgi:hypothetical protein
MRNERFGFVFGEGFCSVEDNEEPTEGEAEAPETEAPAV